ncbi:hypothetical protein GHT06_019418 [Daphnia sinensis]|uniref:Uncharacterized protein n=1 Tax=Daphnia sinensis TaxID=1820382 RepID=A0AAD5PNL4_9CRUS|nr:hypothetical protein GHT06_019418 [Daphnia sinensis]
MAFFRRFFQQTFAKLRRRSKTNAVVIPVGEPSLDEEHRPSQQEPTTIPENNEELPVEKPATGEIRQVPAVKAERFDESKEKSSSLVAQAKRKKRTFFTIQSLPCRESLHHRRQASRDRKRLFRFPKDCKCSWCKSLSPLATKCHACAELYFSGSTEKKPLPFKCRCNWCQRKSSTCSLCSALIE